MMQDRKSDRIAERSAVKLAQDFTPQTLTPVDATPEGKSSSKKKVVEYIADYRFQDGALQFRAKWKGFPASSCEWKKRDFFPNEMLQNFLQDYKKKYLLHCTDKNLKALKSEGMGLEETFAKITLFGAQKNKYSNEGKTFKFTSDYEIKKYKAEKLLKREKDKMNAALKPKFNFEIENEVDVEYLPGYLEWSKNYPGVEAFPKTPKSDALNIKPCECKNNCAITFDEGRIKKPVECCFKPYNSYELDGRLRNADLIYYECDSSCKCDKAKCLNRVVQNGSNCKLCLFRTLDKSWGVKTKEKIRKGTYISEYCGDIIDGAEKERRIELYENVENKNFFSINDRKGKATEFTIDPTVSGNEARFFNHSCEPNMQAMLVNTDKKSMFNRVTFFAKRDIDEEEELTFDFFLTF